MTVTAKAQPIAWEGAATLAAPLPIGARAPSFDGLLGVDGKGYGLSSFRDSDVVVLVFASNRCPTAQSYTRRLKALQEQYGPRGVQLVLINSNDPYLYSAESYERMVGHSRAQGYTFPYLHDEGQVVARAYGPKCTFHAFVLDRDRRLRYEGRFDDARVEKNVTTHDLANALDDLLAGRTVSVPQTEPFGCSLDLTATPAHAGRDLVQAGLWLAIGGAWLIALSAELSGNARLLHHDALIEEGPPVAFALAAFSLSWLVMIAAMMLPASFTAIRTFGAVSAVRGSGQAPAIGFMGVYLATWAFAGLAFFVGDVMVHRLVEATPWLASRAYVIEAALLGAAGVYQFTPWKRRFLEACRHATSAADSDAYGIRAGIVHTLDCVVSSGPLMLVMFAAGAANLAWMVALTALMVYETRGRHGLAVSRFAGAVLLFLATLAITSQGLLA